MLIKLLVLFFTPLISGLLIYLVPKSKGTNFRLLLVFAGSYLFAITVIHILPELYHFQEGGLIGLFVLAGFSYSSCWSILHPASSMVIFTQQIRIATTMCMTMPTFTIMFTAAITVINPSRRS